jgi:HlyD family secretion protein
VNVLKKAVWIMAVIAVALAIGGYVFFSGERKPPIRYRTAPVDRGALVSVVSATGTINPVTSVQVGSQVSGMIESLYADYNSAVKKGQVVARIDPFPYKARRDQAKATLANARASVVKAQVDLAQRKRELGRVRSLLKESFVSQNDVDVAATAHEGAAAQLQVAQAAVEQAEAALEAAELDLKYTVIRSPVDGTVIARQVEVGQRVTASFQIPMLFLIAEDLTNMQVDANVSEADIGGVAEGKEATFTVDAYPGELFHGQVRQVRNAPISVQNVVTYDVVLGVKNPDLRLKPGMTANVSIVVARKDNVLKVPNAALRFTPPKATADSRGSSPAPQMAARGAQPLNGEPAKAERSQPAGSGQAAQSERKADPSKMVWRLSTGGDAEPVPVQPGISDGNSTELITGALQEGDAVIVGIESASTRRPETLPPGFGSGQRRPGSRERGL